MAAVLALTVVPVLLLSLLSISAAVAEGTATGALTAAFFVVVLLGATITLFRWARDVDHEPAMEAMEAMEGEPR